MQDAWLHDASAGHSQHHTIGSIIVRSIIITIMHVTLAARMRIALLLVFRSWSHTLTSTCGEAVRLRLSSPGLFPDAERSADNPEYNLIGRMGC